MRNVASASLLLLAAACGGTTVTATLTVIPSDAPTASPTATASASPTPSSTPSPTSSPSPTPSPTQEPSAPPTPSPTASPAAASPWPACINGWTNPPEGDPERIEGLEILSNYMGVTDPFVVEDMRYFVGPDPDWIIEPRFEAVEHWYIKATLSTDPTYRARWLVERRNEQRLGVSAVAEYDTIGYESPDWSGFIGDGLPREVEGLPGLWGGIQYDFVTGEGDGGFPGLHESQSECMAGT